MWILPRQLHTSAFVPDTEALISDLAEQSQACAQSLLVRSKPSPARTWSLKWKRDSWTQLLSGRILKPSHGPSFTAAWTSSLAATRASHSAPPASDSAPKTQDTSGRLSQPELLQCDQVPVSLKTSRDISRWGCPTSSKTWADWVIERRGAWRQRVNAARLTRGSGSSSWPTIRASEYKDVGPVGSRSHDHMLGKHYLCAVVTQDAANWSTPRAQEDQSSVEAFNKRADAILARRKPTGGRQKPGLTQEVQMYGPAAPASSSSLGSRQGLSWATPNACDHKGATSPEACKKWELRGQNLPEMVNGMWPTTSAGSSTGGQGLGLTGGSGNRNKLKRLCPEGMDMMQPSKLNPRWVETLMGLPIGWTMPSCTSPQTIAPMSCDSSAMELSQPPQSGRSEFSLASCGNWTTPNQMDASIAKPTLRPSRIATGRKTDYLARQVAMTQQP